MKLTLRDLSFFGFGVAFTMTILTFLAVCMADKKFALLLTFPLFIVLISLRTLFYSNKEEIE